MSHANVKIAGVGPISPDIFAHEFGQGLSSAMTYPLRHNMHVTNKLKNTPPTAQPSRPGGNSMPAFMKANGPSDIMQYGFAAVGLMLLAPLFLVIGLLIKWTSQGPILYRGLRVGKDRRIFTIYKFRTLQVGAEEKIGARLLTDRDMYYTRIGKLLKRTKLDELPQLVNVLKGEMNLVGPRPVRPIFLEKLCGDIPRYPIRFALRPGMTGLAQVRGGYFTKPKDKLRYELLYMRKRSLLLDLKLIALTVARIPKEFSSGPFSGKRPSQPRASLPDAPTPSGAGKRLCRDKTTPHTNGRMHFAVSRVTLAVARSYPETLTFSLVRQRLGYAQPLVKP